MKTRIRVGAALLCMAILLAGPAAAQLEGTLFTQPEERAYLDYLREEFIRNNADRNFDIEAVEIPEVPTAVTPEDTGPVEYAFSAVMTRRDGHRVWLNGRLLAEDELPDGMSLVQTSGTVALRIVQGGNTYVLRPGQTVNLTTGTVIENSQRVQPQALSPQNPAAAPAAPAVATAPAADVSVDETATAAAPNEPAVTVPATPAADASAENRADDFTDSLSEMSAEELEELAEALDRVRQLEADEP